MFALYPALIYKERGGERTHLCDDLLVFRRRSWRKKTRLRDLLRFGRKVIKGLPVINTALRSVPL